MAEAVFAHMIQEAGLQGRIEIDSAGTGDWHTGSAAHPGTLGILEERASPTMGVPAPSRGRDLDVFDFIVTMDDENERAVRALQRDAQGHRAQVRPLLSFAPEGSPVHATLSARCPIPISRAASTRLRSGERRVPWAAGAHPEQC
jgi:protein-tyrosine phosphatase